MNFLLHHHFAARDLRSDAAAAGAMLPDVWRMADRRARVRDRARESDSRATRDVLDGIAHHVAVDAKFHSASVFTDGERATRSALGAASTARKLGLFAHVAWELCLDGALVRRVGLAPLLAAVGASIRAVRPDAHHRAARSHAASGAARTDEERALFESRVDEILDAIGRGPWVAGYATGDGIAERLDGVRRRLGFEALPLADRAAVARALAARERDADDAVDELLCWDAVAVGSRS